MDVQKKIQLMIDKTFYCLTDKKFYMDINETEEFVEFNSFMDGSYMKTVRLPHTTIVSLPLLADCVHDADAVVEMKLDDYEQHCSKLCNFIIAFYTGAIKKPGMSDTYNLVIQEGLKNYLDLFK